MPAQTTKTDDQRAGDHHESAATGLAAGGQFDDQAEAGDLQLQVRQQEDRADHRGYLAQQRAGEAVAKKSPGSGSRVACRAARSAE